MARARHASGSRLPGFARRARQQRRCVRPSMTTEQAGEQIAQREAGLFHREDRAVHHIAQAGVAVGPRHRPPIRAAAAKGRASHGLLLMFSGLPCAMNGLPQRFPESGESARLCREQHSRWPGCAFRWFGAPLSGRMHAHVQDRPHRRRRPGHGASASCNAASGRDFSPRRGEAALQEGDGHRISGAGASLQDEGGMGAEPAGKPAGASGFAPQHAGRSW